MAIKNYSLEYLSALQELLESAVTDTEQAIYVLDDGENRTITEAKETVNSRVERVIKQLQEFKTHSRTLSSTHFIEQYR
jgi:hypothetical protein